MLIEVEDAGVGIDAEKLPHVFERFYRVDRSRNRREGGAGLGLAIVDAVAHAHGGSVSIRSVPGVGTTVSLVIPVLRATEPRAVAAAANRIDLEDAREPTA
ncbi:MAG: ATP-binding protein [Gaiellales bacterium]